MKARVRVVKKQQQLSRNRAFCLLSHLYTLRTQGYYTSAPTLCTPQEQLRVLREHAQRTEQGLRRKQGATVGEVTDE